MFDLPLEIQHLICGYLDLHDVLRLCQVDPDFESIVKACHDSYMCRDATLNTNRLIKKATRGWYDTMVQYAKLEQSIVNLSRALTFGKMKEPHVNTIPPGFGQIAMNIASEPSISNDHPYPTGQQLRVTVDDNTSLILDFQKRAVKLQPRTISNIEYIYDSGSTQLVLRRVAPHVTDVEVPGVYHGVTIHNKCSAFTEGIHYVEPYIFRTNNYRCSVTDTRAGRTVARSRFAHHGCAQTTFVTQTHFWSVTNGALYTISLEEVIRGHASNVAKWAKVLQLPAPHSTRVECVNRFYHDIVAITCEGDVMYMVNLNTCKIEPYGFDNDLVRKGHNSQYIYLKGFGHWVVDTKGQVAFIRRCYIDALAEHYKQARYKDFVPLSRFSIRHDAAGRLV